VPLLFSVAYSAVGFSLYFSLGIVAGYGLGLTPLIFLGAGFMFVLATMTFAEGGSMFSERGGSSSMARHGFNEFVSFIAGWALMIDYIIVVALAAVSAPHYLTPLWEGFGHGLGEVLAAVAVVVSVAAINILGLTGYSRQKLLVALAVGDLAVQGLLIVVGAWVVFDPGLLTQNLDLFSSPSLQDVVYALVIATVAFAGLEAASDLAPDIDWRPQTLRRTLGAGAVILPLIYAAVAAISLMIVPVGADHTTRLGGAYVEEPILGVAQNLDPAWVSSAMQGLVVLVAPALLIWAASTAMLGLSRHSYVLATNRQIPSWLGKLGRRRSTPHVAIVGAAIVAIGLVIPADIEVLAGIYAFGATLAIAIAHLSVLRMRATKPNRKRPFRVPFNVTVRGVLVPIPTLVGAVLTIAAWFSVIAFHEEARWVGGGWMVLGIVGYVIYRLGVEKTSLTKRVEVPAEALTKAVPEAEFGQILVPVFGTKLDDDIVGTAGRLADAALEPGETPPALEVIYVVDLPLTMPLTSAPPDDRMEVANAALARAGEVGEEYETVEVNLSVIKARSVGAGIVEAARYRKAEVIVMGGEPTSKIRGGALMGGIGGARPAEIGPVTEYVLRRAPCRVLITAPAG
jgi:APA family basic amino acid/polyamine antiporter